jgi:predicted GH43/DUF377 family glycosyl hydrolase
MTGGFRIRRLGWIMKPEPGDPIEAEGVLNPAAVRGPEGQLYLFPRLVAKGNYSRIGMARVRFDDSGDPVGVEWLGTALEPVKDYERGAAGRGGCEDPRITFVEPLRRYVMTYTALSPNGPRIALAVSEDLLHWRRLGLARFEPYDGIEFEGVDNKDASVFPIAIADPSGRPELAILHRPLFPATRPEEIARYPAKRKARLRHESIWISYCPTALPDLDSDDPVRFTTHHRLAAPEAAWERIKIGSGTPPVMTPLGWLMVYHGVSAVQNQTTGTPLLRYAAGVMVLAKEHPRIRYRSAEPLLTPTIPQELSGTVADVVFPTGIDRRDDLGAPNRLDVYYGMADSSIGVARLDVPSALPRTGSGDHADPGTRH